MQTQYVCWHNLDPDMAKQALDQAVALATNIQLVDGADIDLTVGLRMSGLGFELAPESAQTDLSFIDDPGEKLCWSLVCYLSRPYMPPRSQMNDACQT